MLGSPALLQFFEAHQPRIIILAHTTRVAVDNMLDAGALLGDLKNLVDLLLILGENHPSPGIIDQVGNLFVERILIDAKDHAADGMDTDLPGNPFGTIVADNTDCVSLDNPQLLETEGNIANLLLIIGPGQLFPDAESLFTHCDIIGPMLSIIGEQLGKSIVNRNIGVDTTHQATSPEAASSLRASSSSPR